MRKIRSIALLVLALGAGQVALAEIVNVTNRGEGANRDAAVAKAKKNLEEACTSRAGKPVAGSMKVTFEKPLSNGTHYVDAIMSCDMNK